MIEVKPLRLNKQWFKSYDELFESLNRLENLKMTASFPSSLTAMNWRFTIYAAERVGLFFSPIKDEHIAIKEACEQNLPLIEICTGDFTKPEYVVQTPNLDMSALKKKWALDYCAAHNMAITEGKNQQPLT